LDAGVSDLAAVIESLDSPTVDVTCSGPTTAIGITYTVRHPEKVRRLVLQSPRASGGVTDTDERRRILRELAGVDWEFYLQCMALLNFGWTDVGRRVAEKQAKEAKRGVWARAAEEIDRHDVSSLVAQVKCPTLVLDQRPRAGIVAITAGSQSSEIAAAMPNARLTRYDEDHGWLLASSWDSCLRIVEEFLDEDASVDAREPLPSGTAIILFADIVDSTALTERLGDTAFRDKARALDEAMRVAIRENGGSPVEGKTLGDGVLAVFTSAKQAIACAQACHAAASASGLSLHAGIHAGDVIHEADTVYGGAVNIAARVAAASEAGETLVSGTVRDLTRTSAGVTFEDRGEHALKGIDDTVRVWAVRQA
jgi:class 3 adenylate cyclase